LPFTRFFWHNFKTPFNSKTLSERVVDHEDGEFNSISKFLEDSWKAITEPEAPRLTLVFQWTSKLDVEPTDFTDNLLDACNYKILMSIQGRLQNLFAIYIDYMVIYTYT